MVKTQLSRTHNRFYVVKNDVAKTMTTVYPTHGLSRQLLAPTSRTVSTEFIFSDLLEFSFTNRRLVFGLSADYSPYALAFYHPSIYRKDSRYSLLVDNSGSVAEDRFAFIRPRSTTPHADMDTFFTLQRANGDTNCVQPMNVTTRTTHAQKPMTHHRVIRPKRLRHCTHFSYGVRPPDIWHGFSATTVYQKLVERIYDG